MNNIYLAYVNDSSDTISTMTYTALCIIINNNIKLLTDRQGNYINNGRFLPLSHILDETYVQFNNWFYTSINNQGKVYAEGFYNPEEAGMNLNVAGYGAGIYGFYTKRDKDSKMVYCNNPIYIVDTYHGDSLMLASLQSSLYVNDVISYLSSDITLDIKTTIDDTLPQSLINMWIIVFKRTGQSFNPIILREALITYIIYFFQSENYVVDYYTNYKLKFHPINFIMAYLGYDGVISRDDISDKGCISYMWNDKNTIIVESDNVYTLGDELITYV